MVSVVVVFAVIAVVADERIYLLHTVIYSVNYQTPKFPFLDWDNTNMSESIYPIWFALFKTVLDSVVYDILCISLQGRTKIILLFRYSINIPKEWSLEYVMYLEY